MNEELLIKELQSRNTLAFDFVFNYYYSGLCAYARKYIDDKEIAEDIVQDFFVILWAESPRLEIRSSLKSYLFTSIHNRCLDWHKHQRTFEKYKKSILIKNQNQEIRPEEMIVESELRTAIQKGLGKCPPRTREIFEMSRINGLSNQQIADQLGLSKRTVELQISTALKILRTVLQEYMPLWMIVWLLK